MANYLTILLLLLACFKLESAVSLKSKGNVICYFLSWVIYRPGDEKFVASDVDPNLCTHVIYAFVGLGEDGTLTILDDWEINGLKEVDHLMSLKEQNPELKILVSMGGWNEGSQKYSQVAADPEKRATLINTTLEFIANNGFDGFDLEWLYPGQRDGDPDKDPQNFVILLGELKSALNAQNLILSAMIAIDDVALNISYPDIEAVFNNLDLVHVEDGQPGQHNSNVIKSLKRLTMDGVDVKKMNWIIYIFGILYNNSVAVRNLAYFEICNLGPEWTYVWDGNNFISTKVNGNLTIVYEDTKSLKYKVDLVDLLQLGGVSVYSLDTDDFRGRCNGEKYPLLEYINEHI